MRQTTFAHRPEQPRKKNKRPNSLRRKLPESRKVRSRVWKDWQRSLSAQMQTRSGTERSLDPCSSLSIMSSTSGLQLQPSVGLLIHLNSWSRSPSLSPSQLRLTSLNLQIPRHTVICRSQPIQYRSSSASRCWWRHTGQNFSSLAPNQQGVYV